MNGTVIIDTLLGLILLYLALSVLVSALGELAAQIFKLRSENLKTAVEQLVTHKPIREALFNHPMINALSKDKTPLSKDKGGGPSYIPSGTFALALLDVLDRVPDANPITAPEPDEIRASKLDQRLATLEKDLGFTAEPNNPENFIRSLRVLLRSAKGRMDVFEENVEHWFNSTMERASGWYKRRSQLIGIGIAFVLVGVSNADTIAVGKTLWKEPELRAALAAQATAASRQAGAEGESAQVQAQKILGSTSLTQFPIGWDFGDVDQSGESSPKQPINWGLKLLGLLITAVSVSIGAPFWYQLLGRVVNLRGSGSPPVAKRQRTGADNTA